MDIGGKHGLYESRAMKSGSYSTSVYSNASSRCHSILQDV